MFYHIPLCFLPLCQLLGLKFTYASSYLTFFCLSFRDLIIFSLCPEPFLNFSRLCWMLLLFVPVLPRAHLYWNIYHSPDNCLWTHLSHNWTVSYLRSGYIPSVTYCCLPSFSCFIICFIMYHHLCAYCLSPFISYYINPASAERRLFFHCYNP